jgi:hypothetical protein
MGLIALAWGPDATHMGPIPPCVGLIPVKALCGGLLLIIKPSFRIFAFLFIRATWQVSWGKWKNGGCFQKKIGMPTTTSLKKKTEKK